MRVTIARPTYATLRLYPADHRLAPLSVALDLLDSTSYGKVFLTTFTARAVELAFEPPSPADEIVSIRIEELSLHNLVSIGVRKAARHLGSPVLLLRKTRQVLSGAGTIVLSTRFAELPPSSTIYSRWQDAFESKNERARLLSQAAQLSAGSPLSTLAVCSTASNAGQVQQLCASLAVVSQPFQTSFLVFEHRAFPLPATTRDGLHKLGAMVLPEETDELPLQTIQRRVTETGANVIIFLDQAGRFHDLALPAAFLELANHSEALAVYADNDTLTQSGVRVAPRFKPAWSPHYLSAWDYVGAPVLFRTAALACLNAPTIGHAAPSRQLLLALAESKAPRPLVRSIPRVLFHAQEREPVDELRPLRIRCSISSHPPLVSVLIPSKNNSRLLRRTIKSVATASYTATEIVIIDNGSTSSAQRSLLAKLAVDGVAKVLTDPRPFSFSQLINAGRRASSGTVLLLLNDDIESIEDNGWLQELVARAVQPDVGCVGALLLYPDRRVQHAGTVLGISGLAGHAFRGVPSSDSGDGQRLRAVHEVSAVTGACLAVRASVFDEAGGFDEDLPVTLNDVDFCLRVRELGYRNLLTPHAVLIHRESSSRGLDTTREKLERLARETGIFWRKWGKAAMRDPYYSPHLSVTHEDFRPRDL